MSFAGQALQRAAKTSEFCNRPVRTHLVSRHEGLGLALAIAQKIYKSHPAVYPCRKFHIRSALLSSLLAVFDLDGTLIDTHPDLIDSLNHTIAARDLAPVSYQDLTHLVGHGARAMIERAFALRGQPLTEDAFPPMLERFIDHYRGGMPGKSLPYPGLVDALDRLSAAGVKLAVCTNKMEGLARPLLEGLGLASRFAAITGGDTFTVRKPDAAHLLGTIERAGGDPARTVMIGDSLNDIKVAQNAGIPSIAVPFGYSDVAVETLSPTVVIDHFDQLTVDLVESLIKHSD